MTFSKEFIYIAYTDYKLKYSHNKFGSALINLIKLFYLVFISFLLYFVICI